MNVLNEIGKTPLNLKLTQKAKFIESWRNLLQDAMPNSDGPIMWKVIQGLNGTPDANSPNEAMSHKPSLILNPKLTSSLTTTPGLANSLCHSPTVTLTDSSKNVLKCRLLMMKAVLHF